MAAATKLSMLAQLVDLLEKQLAEDSKQISALRASVDDLEKQYARKVEKRNKLNDMRNKLDGLMKAVAMMQAKQQLVHLQQEFKKENEKQKMQEKLQEMYKERNRLELLAMQRKKMELEDKMRKVSEREVKCDAEAREKEQQLRALRAELQEREELEQELKNVEHAVSLADVKVIVDPQWGNSATWTKEVVTLYDHQFDIATMKLSETGNRNQAISVRYDAAIGNGTFKIAFPALIGDARYVVKLLRMPATPAQAREMLLCDVEVQRLSQHYATVFNSRRPSGAPSLVYEDLLLLKTSHGYCVAERYLEGNFTKWNGNNGYVNTDFTCDAAHAFSHFTFELRHETNMVLDIQGVQDGAILRLSDPAVQSKASSEFGSANLSVKGMENFFSSHKCNSMCRQMGLKSH